MQLRREHAETESSRDLMASHDLNYRVRTDEMLAEGSEKPLHGIFLGVVKAIGTAWSLVVERDKQKADIQIGSDLVERMVHAIFGDDDEVQNAAADVLEMERARNTIAEVIRLRLSQPPASYSLAEALVDVRDYAAAGS